MKAPVMDFDGVFVIDINCITRSRENIKKIEANIFSFTLFTTKLVAINN